MTKDFKYIGKRLVRKDAYDKVTGSGLYTVDIQLPRTLHAKVLRSPHAHARIVKIDASKAMQLPGVIATLTYKDVPRAPAIHHDFKALDYYVLDNKVRWVGDDVAAVAAETEEIAEEALSLIDIKYEVLPSVFTIEAALRPDAPLLHPQLDYGSKGASNIVPTGSRTHVGFGDIDKGLREADIILEENIKISGQCHGYAEQHVALAHWDRPDHLTIWMSTQCPHRMRDEFASILGMPGNRIRAISNYVGGGHGGKARFLRHMGIAALLARKAHRPVRLALSLEETMPLAVRDEADVSWKVGLKKDGTVTTIKRDCIMNTGAYVITGGQVGEVSLHEPVILYKLDNYSSDVTNVYTNTNPSGSYRGFGITESTTSLGVAMFRAAEAVGMDPLQFLLKNVIPSPARIDYFRLGATKVGGDKWDVEGTPTRIECLRQGAERFGWKDKWKGWGQPTMVDGPKRRGVGIGLTSGMNRGGTFVGSAIIMVNLDGSATVFIGSTELGQGVLTVAAKIAAEELGVPYENVTVVSGDTDITPFDSGQSASHTTFDVGLPTLEAAKDAKRQLLELAAPKLGVKPEELETEDGFVYVKGTPEKRISFRDAIFTRAPEAHKIMDVVPIIAHATLPSGRKSSLSGCAIDFVEVEVDTETGEVRTVTYVTAVDPGRAINPDAVEGQYQHALSAGIGWSLMEKLVIDRNTGRPLSANYLEYKMPTTLDIAENSSIVMVESIDPQGPFGARGSGEEAIGSSAAAFINAIHSALGVKLNEFPITPDKVLEALGKR